MLKNDDFYNVDGSLDVEKAKQAYYGMLAALGYPMMPILRTANFWVTDLGSGKFLEVGLAGLQWANNEAYGYSSHDIFLLPGQIIAEHNHVDTKVASSKMESWTVRFGSMEIYNEGTPTPGADIPNDIFYARTRQALTLGQTAHLEHFKGWHWMKAGPRGAVFTETASYHDVSGIRFSNPALSL